MHQHRGRDLTASLIDASVLIVIACVSATFGSCTTFSELSHDEIVAGAVPIESTIRVTRLDSTIVLSGPYRHLMMRDSADLVLGTGSDRKTGKPFSGRLQRSQIDSMRDVLVAGTDGEATPYLICWTAGGRSFAFATYDHLVIGPGDPPGLWCAGMITNDGRSSKYRGRIDLDSIRSVEVEGWALLRPSVPTSASPAASLRQRFNIGLGFATTSVGGAAALFTDYAVRSQANLYEVRFVTTFTPPLPEAQARARMTEIGALYGLGASWHFVSVAAAAGISYVRGSKRTEQLTISRVSVPVEIEVAITPYEYSGISAKFFSTVNSGFSWSGFVVCFHIGV